MEKGETKGPWRSEGPPVLFKEDSSKHSNCTCKCLQNGSKMLSLPQPHNFQEKLIWGEERRKEGKFFMIDIMGYLKM